MFLELKSPFPCKGLLMSWLSFSFLVFRIQAYEAEGVFQSHVFYWKFGDTLWLWDAGFDITVWTCTTTHVQGSSHNYIVSRWGPSGQGCLPSENSRTTVCFGNGMMPIELCRPYITLWDERCVWDGRLESLTFTPLVLDEGHVEVLIWRNVDTDVNDDP